MADPGAGLRRARQRADRHRAGRPGARRAGADRRLGPVAAHARLPDGHRLRQLRRHRGRCSTSPSATSPPSPCSTPSGRHRSRSARSTTPGSRTGCCGCRILRAAPRPPAGRAPAGRASSARASARTPARTSSCTGARSARRRWGSTGRCGSGRRTAASGCSEVTGGAARGRRPRPRSPSSTTSRQLEALDAGTRGRRLRYVLLSHDNDGVTKFGPDLLVDRARLARPRPAAPRAGARAAARGASPRRCAGGPSRRSSRASST